MSSRPASRRRRAGTSRASRPWRARFRVRSCARSRAVTMRTSSWRPERSPPPSAIHRQYKLNMAQEEILRLAAAGVGRARELCADVEFSPEDASRTELEFLAQVVEVA